MLCFATICWRKAYVEHTCDGKVCVWICSFWNGKENAFKMRTFVVKALSFIKAQLLLENIFSKTCFNNWLTAYKGDERVRTPVKHVKLNNANQTQTKLLLREKQAKDENIFQINNNSKLQVQLKELSSIIHSQIHERSSSPINHSISFFTKM